jgi:small conductance mechanosensitive channel
MAFCLTWLPITIAQGQLPSVPQLKNSQSVSPSWLLPIPTKKLGNLVYAPARLDGRDLFDIAAPFRLSDEKIDLSLEFRIYQIESALYAILKTGDPKTLQLSVATLNNQTVIIAQDEQRLKERPLILLTITEYDAQLHGSPISALAKDTPPIIYQTLQRAWQERQPEYLWFQAIKIAGIVLAIFGISISIAFWQRYLQRRWQTFKKQKPAQLDPVEPLSSAEAEKNQLEVDRSQLANRDKAWRHKRDWNILLWRLSWITHLYIWLGGINVCLHSFPQTRILAFWLQGKPTLLLSIFLALYLMQKIGELAIDWLSQVWTFENDLSQTASPRASLRISTHVAVLKGMLPVCLVLIGLILSLLVLGVPWTTLLAGVGILGVGISLAAQDLLKAAIRGIVILWTDPYAVDDVIIINDNLDGLVENFNLFYTQLRNADGFLTTIGNEQIQVIKNLSKEWSRVNFAIQLDYETDVVRALAAIEQTAQELYSDPDWQEQFVEPPEVLGVDELTHAGILIRVWLKVQPLQQWAVGREFRLRLKSVLDREGIHIGIPKQTLRLLNTINNGVSSSRD